MRDTLDRSPPLDLPAAGAPLFGREQDVARLLGLLTSGARLVTLTGPGGVGKTRLALQTAESAAELFPDGISTIAAASISDPELLPAAIAAELLGRESGAKPALPALAEAIGARRVLLVVDNLEQIVEAGSFLVRLLAAVPSLAVLVTSRTPLRVTGEIEYPVSPLDAPAPGSVEPAAIITAPSVQLFVRRARAVRPEFEVTADNAAALAEIVRRLDGLPLALELAAARIKVLSPQALLSRLSHSLQVLTGGPRDAPARLQTMRDAIAWSYALLDDDLRGFFRALGVFVGGFTLDAATQVAGRNADDELETLDRLAQLVDHSLVVPSTSDGDEPRFAMLETIREFALEELSAHEELDWARARHAEWVRAWVTTMTDSFMGPRETAAMNQIERDVGNLRVAIPVLIEASPEAAATFLYDAWYFWGVRGHYREGLDWLSRIDAQRGALSEQALAKVDLASGFLRWALGEYDQSIHLVQAARARFDALGDELGVAKCGFALGSIYRDQDESALAEAELRRSLEVFERLDEPAWMGFCLSVLGAVARQTGRYKEAVELLERGLRITRSINFPGGILPLLDHLGDIAREQDDHLRALEYYRQTMGLWIDQRDPHGAADSLAGFGASLRALGDPAESARLLGATARTYERLGFRPSRYSGALSEETLAQLRQSLGEEAFEREWQAGRELSLEAALERAVAYRRHETGVERFSAPNTGIASSYGLTRREQEILDLLIEGRSNAEIGEALFISPRTAGTHLANIFAKLGVPTRTAAVAKVLRCRAGQEG